MRFPYYQQGHLQLPRASARAKPLNETRLMMDMGGGLVVNACMTALPALKAIEGERSTWADRQGGAGRGARHGSRRFPCTYESCRDALGERLPTHPQL